MREFNNISNQFINYTLVYIKKKKMERKRESKTTIEEHGRKKR